MKEEPQEGSWGLAEWRTGRGPGGAAAAALEQQRRGHKRRLGWDPLNEMQEDLGVVRAAAEAAAGAGAAAAAAAARRRQRNAAPPLQRDDGSKFRGVAYRKKAGAFSAQLAVNVDAGGRPVAPVPHHVPNHDIAAGCTAREAAAAWDLGSMWRDHHLPMTQSKPPNFGADRRVGAVGAEGACSVRLYPDRGLASL